MAGGFDQGQEDAPMAEINMVPLIDVMLVLMLVFMITAPLMTHSVPIQLPRASNQPPPEDPQRIAVSINEAGQIFFEAKPVDRSTLQAQLQEAATRNPQPILNLSADRTTQYEAVAQVLGDAARAGLSKIGFITDPREDSGAASPAAGAPK